MGKPKKGKKGRQEGRQDDDFGDDDAVLDPIVQSEVVATEDNPPVAPTKAGKKGKGKKGKRADDGWEDDVSKEIEALSLGKELEETNGDIEEAKPMSAKAKKREKKKNKQKKEEEQEDDSEDEEMVPAHSKMGPAMSAFAMLDVEDVDEEEDELEEEELEKMPQKRNNKNKKSKPPPEEETDEPNVEEVPQPEQKKGNKEKKKDEDIDAILADLEKPSEKSEGKKKKKKKEKFDNFSVVEEASSGFELVDIESMTQEQIAMLLGGDDDEEDDRKKKKKEKKKKKKVVEEEIMVDEEKTAEEMETMEEKEDDKENKKDEDEEDAGGTVKTAAQKKKEKRERQKQQKLLEKQKQMAKGAGAKKDEESEKKTEELEKKADTAKLDEEETGEGADDDENKKKSKKDRRKKKGEKEEKVEEEKKKKPGNKQLRAMQEALQRVKEEEEAQRLAEEERERKIEEARKAKEEAAKIEAEKREREKQKRKEKIERQKREGTFKTKAQREAEKRAREMLAARGLDIPPRAVSGITDGEQKRKRIVYDNRKKRKNLQPQNSQELISPTDTQMSAEVPTPTLEEKIVTEEEAATVEDEEEEVLDSWELVEEKLEEKEDTEEAKEKSATPEADEEAKEEEEESESESEEESSEEEGESSDEESSSEDESSDDEDLTAEERAFNKADKRIKRRRALAESKRNQDVLRAPVVCVLGHVDTGKTKILDKLRRTNVQDGEAGGITQQIGATNMPREAIQEKTSMCKEFLKKELLLPGLLIIDTPGHESFSNLRNRGSSLCDIAILVVDIMHGLEPQTIESINLLKSRKTPFVVALNKIDRLFGWKPNPHTDIVNTLKKQSQNTKHEFEDHVRKIIVQFAEQGLNVALFYENKNPREYISMCPTSAQSGDGMGNLVALICELTQNFLPERVAFIDDLQATVMEVKALPGLGMTIDVIIVNGSLREGATIVVAGTEGPIVTQIRGLLSPQPMKELRVKGAYIHSKEVKAAQGVKIIAKDLDKALAGLPLYVSKYDDEIPVYRDDLERSLEDILKGIKVQQEGVFVQASTLGSLEALLEFLRTSKIPCAGINIGPVHRRDIMRASVMLERDTQYAVILAFDVKVEREAQEMADNLGVRIFTADIIYHLFDAFTTHRADLKRQKQEEFKHIAVFPCKLRVLPSCIFNSRDPIVMGVVVEAGFIKEGTPVCVPSKEFLELGRVTSIECNHKAVERASKGQEVCIKIENVPGETPKLYGRHFDHTDMLMSKISRASIDAVKKYFREEMTKNDWQLVLEMKQLFEIL